MSPATASTLALYRDDGPLVRAMARSVGRPLPVPALIFFVVGAIPLAVLVTVLDDSDAAIGAGVAWLLVLGGLSAARPPAGRFGWLSPPLVRLVEYGALVAFALLADDSAMPACFAFLCAVAFRHYDGVYRMRHQGAPAAQWARDLGGGWDGRVLLGYVLLVAGGLTVGLYVAAALLAVVSVAESVTSWLRFSRAERPAAYADEEDEEE